MNPHANCARPTGPADASYNLPYRPLDQRTGNEVGMVDDKVEGVEMNTKERRTPERANDVSRVETCKEKITATTTLTQPSALIEGEGQLTTSASCDH